MSTFKGTLQDLKDRVSAAQVDGEWDDEGSKHTFRSRAGGILNWWPSTGTIQVQGKAASKQELDSVLIKTPIPEQSLKPAVVHKQQISIVQGHDTDARDQLELALHRLELDPYALMNESGGGKTLIEALEGEIGRDFSSDFGIVLMTPDDVGYSTRPERSEPRARQNVVLETAMLLSSLTRQRMAIVVKGHVEIPSDLQGIIRFGYNGHLREIVPKLSQRLREAGFDLEPDQIAAAAQ